MRTNYETSRGVGTTAGAAPLHIGGRMELTVGVLAFVVGTALGAYVRIPVPLTPVPMTLQPLFVLLAGALLGPVAGASSMLAYLGLGAAGVPVFSGGGAGIAWLLGPTGGYLMAYPIAAFVTGKVAGSSAAWLRLAIAFSAGILVIYLGGVAQLQLLTPRDFGTVLGLAVTPFIVGDLLKIAIGILVVRAVRGTLRSSGQRPESA